MSCRINRLLFAKDLGLLSSSQQGPRHALDLIISRRKKYRGIMSLHKPKAVYAASEQNALQQVEKSKYIDVVFMSDGRWSDEVHGWIAKANAVLHELIALWSQNGSFQTPQICLFLNRFLFRPLLMILNLG